MSLTLTTPSPSAATADLSRPTERIAAAGPARFATPAALAASGLLALVGFALHPIGGDDDERFVASLNGHLDRWAAAHVLETLAFLAMLIGVGACARLARGRGRAGRVTMAGAVLVAVGAVLAVFESIGHGFLADALAERSAVSTALSTRIQVDYAELPWVAPTFLGVLIAQLGFMVVAAGLFLSRAVPRWVAVLLLLCPVPIAFAGAGAPALLGVLPFAVATASIAREAATV